MLLDLDCGVERITRGAETLMFPRTFLPRYYVRKGNPNAVRIVLPGIIGSDETVVYSLFGPGGGTLPSWIRLEAPTTMVITNVPDNAVDLQLILQAERGLTPRATMPFELIIQPAAVQFERHGSSWSQTSFCL